MRYFGYDHQSLMHNDKYRYDFSPTDFDLLISDEAAVLFSGNAEAVFEYFIVKLDLTITPKDYLKGVDPDKVKENDPRRN
jgi:type I restriction enzyme R subunit